MMWPWLSPEGEELDRQLTREAHTALCAVFDERFGMSETPKAGDKVRISFEAEYVRETLNHTANDHIVTAGAGDEYDIPYTADIEIIKRADDPSRDPVGTVRRFDYSAPVVWVKTDRFEWSRTPRRGISRPWRDDEVTEAEVIGAVPGTPAAEAAGKPAGPEYEYYRGDYNHEVYRVKGDQVGRFSRANGVGWYELHDYDVTADDVRDSGWWTKLDCKPSDVD